MGRAYYLKLNFVLKFIFAKTFICNLILDKSSGTTIVVGFILWKSFQNTE